MGNQFLENRPPPAFFVKKVCEIGQPQFDLCIMIDDKND